MGITLPAYGARRAGNRTPATLEGCHSCRSRTFDLRFHVLALPNVPWLDYRDRVRRVEDAGFDIVELGDHFVDWEVPAFERYGVDVLPDLRDSWS